MGSNAQSAVRRRERGSEHDEWAAAKSARGQSCDFGFGWQHLRVSAYESYFFFLLLRLRLRLLSLGKAMHCCAAVVRWGGERDREREAVRTLPNGIKRNRHYAATKATLSRLRLHLRLLRLQLVVVAAVSVVVVVFLRFGLTSQRVNNL